MFSWRINGISRDYSAPTPVQSTRRLTGAARVSGVAPIGSESGRRTLRGYEPPEPVPKPREKAILVEQIMSTPVITISPSATLGEVRNLFKLRRFRHVPVIDGEQRLIGIVSDRDLLHQADEGAESKTAEDIMTGTVLTTFRDTPIREVARVMFMERISAMPVIEDQRPIGIVTTTDILGTVMNEVPLELWI